MVDPSPFGGQLPDAGPMRTDRYMMAFTDPGVRHAHQVAYSVRMVAEIAAGYDGALDQSRLLLARCMLDSFYVHIRLLAEFLVKPAPGTSKPTKDFGPSDFGISWTPPTGEGPDRLLAVWDVASKYVVHFGRPRVPESLDELRVFEIGGPYFRKLAIDALDCFTIFVDAVSGAAPTWQDGERLPDPEAEPELWTARIARDVGLMLRSALRDALQELAAERN